MSTKINIDKVYGITTTLDFGKYNGYSLASVAGVDPEYLIWAQLNVSQFKMSKSAKKIVFDYLNPIE